MRRPPQATKAAACTCDGKESATDRRMFPFPVASVPELLPPLTMRAVPVHSAKQALVVPYESLKRKAAVLIGFLVAGLAPRAAHTRDRHAKCAERSHGSEVVALAVAAGLAAPLCLQAGNVILQWWCWVP
jgi:hypothetical protein